MSLRENRKPAKRYADSFYDSDNDSDTTQVPSTSHSPLKRKLVDSVSSDDEKIASPLKKIYTKEPVEVVEEGARSVFL